MSNPITTFLERERKLLEAASVDIWSLKTIEQMLEQTRANHAFISNVRASHAQALNALEIALETIENMTTLGTLENIDKVHLIQIIESGTKYCKEQAAHIEEILGEKK